ncbi:MAG: PQQ-binding-like beta-propeller repeat protein [Bryobacterales bacterium]|nr:PQQ-binding-like beta-propeller repeat protein [Bryobacterales bacterium]
MIASPRTVPFAAVLALTAALALSAEPNIKDSWHQWRGPHNNGVAEGDAPLHFSGAENVKWKINIPGKGNSTPVIWGDTIFLTTAVPTESTPQAQAGGGRRAGRGGPGGPQRGGPGARGRGFDPARMLERLPEKQRKQAEELLKGRSMDELSDEERQQLRAIMRSAFAGGRGRRGERGGPGGPGGRRGERGGPGGRRGGPGGPASGGSAIPVHKFVVMAIDKNTGKVLWEQTATEQRPHEGHHAQYGSFASNSPITDGETLYVNFGSRGMYAFDLEGNLKWKKDLGQLQMRLAFGEGIAPIIHGNHLVIQNDHEGESYIVVLDKRDGKEIWRAAREERSSWPQPIVVEHEGRKQLVTSSTRVRSYDLESGELIWEAGGLGGNAIPAVVNVDNEMVIAMTGWRDANAMAIKLGGSGDLTDSTDYIAWSNQRGNSYTASPVLHDGILYFITDRGMVSAVDAKSGEPFYLQQRLPEVYSFKASPVAANGKLYLATEQGDVVVLKLGKTYEVLATNEMGDEMFVSSPVVVGGDLFLRSQDELFCISGD